ncbi:autophagy-related protein 27 [Hypoxylon fragiforme]|uniref:autophagy-related protein 27 n=1 Tax=Hypoxylon fragiforme TaxID=63214 RepID=UPI0020C5BDEC|nr:autophagy-related protein 27 [Hypoxylon fragiforme]KAI2610776.1 autophagy-related protein 27 [Hypoxylon fragiforme]
MKVPTIHVADATLLLSLLLAPLPTEAMLNCKAIVADKQRFDLSKLGGPHSVVTSHISDGISYNTTYTVDICRPLKKKGDVNKKEQCPNGSRVCAIERRNDAFDKAIPLAGELQNYGGGPLDSEATRLSTSDSNSDSDKEGVLLVLKGGFFKFDSGYKREQRTIIEFLCDQNRNGTEGEFDPADDKYEDDNDTAILGMSPLDYRAEGDEGDGGDDNGGEEEPPKDVQLGIENDPSLIFKSYAPLDENSNVDVLRLTWKSKYACEKREDDGEGEEPQPSAHWGFFTWMVILIFLGTASYLIFGSWLNYNRYGARGWDLLPHGDTIRDIPYLLKDWTRRVLNTMQGTGSRGGYSAV